MCGIAGFFDERAVRAGDRDRMTAARSTDTDAGSIDIDGMLAALAHRGPDAGGTYRTPPGAPSAVLGHRRLSIVDLTGGDQPLLDGPDAALVANGEIYNAGDLRADLDASFSTGSDNEAILHVLADGGVDGVDRLNGMFAFAAVRDGELILGRDPIGIKPLYTGRHRGNVVFGSEIKALPAGTVDVAPLAPGTVWSSRTGACRYYEVPDPEPAEGDFEHHARAVRSSLEAAVRRRLMADVPVGSFLSGGLDSSAIVALLRPHVEDLHTFSVGLEASPDLAAAQVVADHLGTIHHSYVLDPDEIVAELPEIVLALESFDQDLVRSAVPTWFTARLAAEHLKVVMTGEGADELFAGYRYHKQIGSDGDLHADARRSIGELHHVNLQRVDRLTMAHSLEARVPFLDLDVIETALSIPPALRRPGRGAPEKALLRAAVSDLLPEEIVWRDKAQFDEGSGTADLLPLLFATLAGDIDAEAYSAKYPEAGLRSAEECHYHSLLVDNLEDPAPVLANVGRWSQRD